MKKNALPLVLLFTIQLSLAQSVDKIITEGNVSRVLKTLSSDAMMGRPATDPARIEPAIAFIENEFKNIGLKPLKGLTGFRQQFEKEKIATESVDANFDGEKVDKSNVVIISDRSKIDVSSNLLLRSITFDSTVTNKRQYFLGKIGQFLRDTTSGVVLVAQEFHEIFTLLRGRYQSRFTNNNKAVKIFVLGRTTASSFTVKATQKIQTIRMTNVAGMLEGKTRPEEMVLFSAHYDHLGIMPAVEGDSIANGADDDASGTTGVIELARYFKNVNSNKRTLIFIAFTAEEIGGFGSKYFSEQLDPDKVVAMINIEMIGKLSKWGIGSAFMSGYERSDLGEILNKNLTGSNFSIRPDPYIEQNLFYRSDNATLARLGVPAHSVSTDQIDVDKLYHSVKDEFESINIKNMTTTIRGIATSSKSIVDGTDTPRRIDKAAVN
jgi:hypothetical protein